QAAHWTPVALPVTGADLHAAGIPTGPEVGRLLAEIEGWWIDGDFRADRAACLEELRTRLAAAR
ncbi:MAG: CCA tRNA nucleotidyltransferase, partial [Alphaproteobacteria bacterium]|nr:CCA tRNA nucleotidyltransferase [Alphaproteobacteria bacterium]